MDTLKSIARGTRIYVYIVSCTFDELTWCDNSMSGGCARLMGIHFQHNVSISMSMFAQRCIDCSPTPFNQQYYVDAWSACVCWIRLTKKHTKSTSTLPLGHGSALVVCVVGPFCKWIHSKNIYLSQITQFSEKYVCVCVFVFRTLSEYV